VPFDTLTKPAKQPTPAPELEEINAPPITGHGARLASLTISLSELIREETQLLGKRLTKEAQKLHGQKNRLMAEYRETLNLLQVNDKLLGPKDSAVRQYIRKLTDRFREILRDHARIVLRLKSVAEGIIKSVGEEVIKKNRPVVGYGRNAGYRMPTQIPPTSLQLNQVI
jgi:hypothetical protein